MKKPKTEKTKIWKPLTAENLIRAQCIFVSIGRDYKDIKSPEFLDEKCGEHFIKLYASEAVMQIKEGNDYEFILRANGVTRPRLYAYTSSDPQARELFPDAEYMLYPTHMNHFDFPYDKKEKEKVRKRFRRIEDALLKEDFPTLKRN